MRLSTLLAGFSASQLFSNVLAWDPTDSLMDADQMQSGYLPNHNIDPSVVSSSAWGQIWAYNTGYQEQFYAKPLTFTPASTGRQVVIAFSEWNRIYSLDAINGSVVAKRDLGAEGEIPFAVSDLGSCNDISDHIGITGTPVIDNVTETIYFWAKGYNQYGANAATGYQNGAYRFHAIDAVTLKEKPGFPNNIQGTPADNDPAKVFIGGINLQRPALNLVNGIVFTGFGGHCDQYNYTGWLIGMDAKTGDVLTAYVTSGGSTSPQPDGTWTGGGGGAAIWMGGSMCPSDQSGRIFFVTGNGQKVDDNQNLAASGRVHLDTLSEAVVNMAINSTTRKVTQQDYFEPYSYQAMDAGDRDLGSGGLILLDQSVFVGGGVSRMGMAVGKNGIAYFLNLDNLGGYKLGSGGTDNILQTINMPNNGAVFACSGSYPLEGGFVYITPVGLATQVYKLEFTQAGLPQFVWYGATPDNSTGRPGTGPATVTTYKGQAGTAILWIVDPNVGLKAYNAVPVNGVLTPITLPSSGMVSKYQRPVFGNGRYYMGSSNGYIRGYGSPTNLPMTCTSPLEFGTLAIGNKINGTISCRTSIKLQVTGYAGGSKIFVVQNSTFPTGKIFSAESTFNITVTYDLSTTASSIIPGTQGSSIEILTTNSVTGYAPQEPITFTATAVSTNPFVTMSPLQVTFEGIVVGSAYAAAGSDSTFIISNVGLNTMHILGMAYMTGSIAGGTAVYHNLTTTTNVNGTNTTAFDSNGYFTSENMPSLGQTVLPGDSVIVDANFNCGDNTGTFYTTLMVFTDGGNAYSIFTGSAASTPIAFLEYSNGEGGWNTIDDCANVTSGCSYEIDFATSHGLTSQTIQLRLSNNGGSVLTITKSKPLEGTALGAANPETDFAEAMTIQPGAHTLASVVFSPPDSILNGNDVTYTGTWTLNTDDLTFGIHSINFVGVLTSNKTGPLLSNGQAQYVYLGCYLDEVGGVRIESKEYVNTTGNTNGWCQTNALNYGAVFAGTEYQQECWVGNVIPPSAQLVSDALCTYTCAGDSTQICGGVGGYLSLYYDSTRYFPSNGTILGTSGAGPQIPKTINNGSWNYAGCYSDSQTARVFSKENAGSNIDLEVCGTYCAGFGYTVFGVEYADECYCGSSFAHATTLHADTDCNMQCAANATEFCGGSSRLSLYIKNGTTLPAIPGTTSATSTTASTVSSTSAAKTSASTGQYISLGCYTDSTASRTLQGAFSYDDIAMTVEECGNSCIGYTYFGVEYSQECYCDNSFMGSWSIATDGRCNMPCKGNANEMCGGINGLNVYSYGNTTTTSSIPASTTTSTTASATTGPSIPLTVNTGSGWTFQSCWSDNTTIRTLQSSYTAPTTMNVENCASFCSGYKYFGLEYYAECYCGNTLTYGSAAIANSNCNYLCKGSSSEYCGGLGALQLYQNYTVPLNTMSSSVSSTSKKGSSTLTSTTSSSSTSSSSSKLTTTTLSTSSRLSSSSTSTKSSSSITSKTSSLSSSFSKSSSTSKSSGSSSSVTSSSTSSKFSSTSSSVISSATSSSTSSKSSSSFSSRISNSATSSFSSSSGSSATSSKSSSSKFTTRTSSSSSSSSSSVVPTTLISSSSSKTTGSTSSTKSSTSFSTSSKASSFSSSSTKSSSSSSSTISSSSSSSTHPNTSSTSSSTISSMSSSSTHSSTTLKNSSSSIKSSSSSSSPSITSSSSSATATIATSLTVTSSSATSTATANPWSYAGCANDTVSARALTGSAYSATTGITVEACQAFCQSKNYQFAGLEYAAECYCGSSLSNNALLGQTGCTMKCNGNSGEVCGGSSRLSMYNNTAYVPPSIKVAVGWQYFGCYTELTNARAIGTLTLASTSSMTVELCVSTCQSKGLTVAGIEYGSQCFCGSGISGDSKQVSSSECEVMLCPGNSAEYCSAGDRLQTYIMNNPIST